MNPNVDEAVPGPSKVDDPEVSKSEPSLKKTVSFEENADEEESSPSTRKKRIDSQTRFRRQSVMGKSGFVTQLLEEHLDEDTEKSEDEPERKPIRKQTLAERRASVKAVEADMTSYMKEATRKSKASISARKSGSNARLPTLSSAEKLEELRNLSKLLPDESLPSSAWKPSHILDEQTGIQQERSWVGTYIVGKDYWSHEEDDHYEKTKVGFSMDEKRKPWYEMPLRKSSLKDSFRALKPRSLSKLELFKGEMEEEYEEKRKQRMLAASDARQETKKVDVWSEPFKDYFKDISRSSEFSHHGTHMSMVDADKWLEKAGILDHNELTLIHTGFCFLANGGSRHRGLSFSEFSQFLQMISITTGLPLVDITRRMIACQRIPDT